MKKVFKSISAMMLAAVLMVQTAAASPAPEQRKGELEAAIEFAGLLQSGENTMYIDAYGGFDYGACYRYVSMLWRDSYVFEYMPLPYNSYMRVVYNDEAKHAAALEAAAVLCDEIIDADMTDRESYEAIHDWMLDNVEYDMHAALNQATETGDAFSAYGALVDGLAVCDGISAAFAMVCRSAGLPCIYVASTEMNHSWNAVLCDGEVRYIDVTYDLTGNTDDKYLLLDENELSRDHSWDKEMVRALTSRVWDERYISAYTLNRIGGLFRGSDKGWELDRSPSRAEAAIMLVRFLGLEQKALEMTEISMPFTDVNPNHAGYIALLYEMGLTKGTSPTTYSPDLETRPQDYMTFMLRALGYDDAAGDFSWKTSLEDSVRLRVLNGEEYVRINEKVFDRGMMSYASLAVLRANEKGGKPLCERLCEAGILSEKNLENFLKKSVDKRV
ncbi:MAG: S-layer homology domain-containing protein [Clostridia bacterium]|nr:S-layer homology domain-containing protein [Clostridia bacterium]